MVGGTKGVDMSEERGPSGVIPVLEMAANEPLVAAMLKILCNAFDQFADEHPDFTPADAFMAAHNFHKIIVLRGAEGNRDEVIEVMCNMAATTFALAMEKRNLYKRDNQ
jgi:hypothetical protein